MMKLFRLVTRRSRDERGAALVEFAFIVVLLLTIVMGTVEMGLAFKDWLSISTASREAVRVGSAAGNDPNTDCFMLEAMAGALFAVQLEDIVDVTIYDAESGPLVGPKNVYRVKSAADDDAILLCDKGWFPIQQGWDPSSRGVTAGDLSLLGVQIRFNHDWVTDIGPFGGTSQWTDDAVMRLEPKQFS